MEGDSRHHRHVQALLDPAHGEGEMLVAGRQHLGRDPTWLVAQHQAQRRTGSGGFQRHGEVRQLQRRQGRALPPQALDGLEGMGVIAPGHRLLGPQGRLVEAGVGRNPGDAAQEDVGRPQPVGAAQDAADVPQAADPVQKQADRTGAQGRDPPPRGLQTARLQHGFVTHQARTDRTGATRTRTVARRVFDREDAQAIRMGAAGGFHGTSGWRMAPLHTRPAGKLLLVEACA